MQTATNAVATTQGKNAADEPLKLRSRIGSTVYEVNVYFNKDAKDTMDDIILRIIGNNAPETKMLQTGGLPERNSA